jgi:hypothetical protein
LCADRWSTSASVAPFATADDHTADDLGDRSERVTRSVSCEPHLDLFWRISRSGEHSVGLRRVNTRQQRSDLATADDRGERNIGSTGRARTDDTTFRRDGRHDPDAAPHGARPTDRGFGRHSPFGDVRRRH